MAGLPTVGGSTDVWGTALNGFLLVAHNADGTLQSSQIQAALGQYLKVGTNVYAFTPVGANSAYLVIDKGTTGSDASVVMRDAGAIRAEFGLATDDSIHFKTATGTSGSEIFTDALIIDTNNNAYFTGKIGIGTVPVEKLHLYASSTSVRTLGKFENGSAGGAGLQLKSTSADWSVATDIALNGGNNYGVFDNVAGYPPRIMIDGSGNVAVGSDTPGAKLDIVGSLQIRGDNGLSAMRLRGRKTTTGAPTTGTWAVGDVVMDSAKVWWLCTVAGTPGTWV